MHEFEDGLYLVVDIAHKVLRSQTCFDLMSEIHRKYANDPTAVRQQIQNLLVGSVVLTKYNNRTYKIDDIVWDDTPATEFSYHNERITYRDYYR